MEQNYSSEIYSHSVCQEISYLECGQKSHYCVHKDSPLEPILSQMSPPRTFTSYFFIPLNVIFLLLVGRH
jgi:hypothetical protein